MSGRFLKEKYSYESLVKEFDLYLSCLGSLERSKDYLPDDNPIHYIKYFKYLIFNSKEFVYILKDRGFLKLDSSYENIKYKEILSVVYDIAIGIFNIIPPRTKEEFVILFISKNELNIFSFYFLKSYQKITLRLKAFHMCLTKDEISNDIIEPITPNVMCDRKYRPTPDSLDIKESDRLEINKQKHLSSFNQYINIENHNFDLID